MLPNPKMQNPFEQEDWFSQIITRNREVQAQSKMVLKKLLSKKQFQKSNPIMTSYLKIVHLITRNAVLATIIMLIALTTLSVSAAQVLAPEDYKPINQIQNKYNQLFERNKQAERNPYTALKPDEENDVVKLEECDLAIKYPKQIKGEVISPTVNKSNYSNTLVGELFLNSRRASENQQSRTLNTFNIGCYQRSVYENTDESLVADYIAVSKEDLLKETGWFIGADKVIDNFQISKSVANEFYRTIEFNHQGKFYRISFNTTKNLNERSRNDEIIQQDIAKGGIFGEQVQIQFNSLVDNQANVIPEEKAEESNSSASSQTSTSRVSLKSNTNLIKRINDQVSTNASGVKSVCGIPNIVTYITNNDYNNPTTKTAIIGNKSDYMDNSRSLELYNLLSSYLENPIAKPEPSVNFNLASTFSNSCSPLFSNYIKDVQNVEFPNTDKSKILIAQEGQADFTNIVVRIYAKKGDNIITLSQKLRNNSGDYEKYLEACQDKGPDNTCRQEFVTKYNQEINSPENLRLAEKVAQELINTFEIE